MSKEQEKAREQRGRDIAKVAVIARRADGSWAVPSMSGQGKYTVKLGDKPHCTCPDCANGYRCKHIYAVEFWMQRETKQNPDGSVTVTESVTIQATKRTTYKQDWPNYNTAQTNEGDQFLRLLTDLCDLIPDQPPKSTKGGRPAIPLSAATFSCIYKVYSTFSGRRFISDLRAAHAQGKIACLPHFNSIFNYFENPAMTPVLQGLIGVTAAPLASVEKVVAADASGFSVCRYVRYFDQKYGKMKVEHDWVKCHIMCGVKTNVVTAVEIKERLAQDSPLLPALLDETAKNFKPEEVCADKGYSSIANVEKVASMGAMPFICYKDGHTGKGGGMWEKMFHFFLYKKEEFMQHYHQRSNVESTFSMVKAKFGHSVRSKTDVAMANEVLCKFICHNICCLISAMYELGVQPSLSL